MQLHNIPTWAAWIDNGSDAILQTSEPGVPLIAALTVGEAVVVVAVPRTVPAARIAEVVAQAVPDDGSKDILVLRKPGGPIVWPMLFVDALAMVDPKAAAQLRANDLAAMS